MFLIILLFIVLIVDFYFYQGLKTVIRSYPVRRQKVIKLIYWLFTIMVITYMAISAFRFFQWPIFIRIYFTSFIFIVFVSKLFASIVLILEDLVRIFKWIFQKIKMIASPKLKLEDENFRNSRLKFINQTAMFIASIPFLHMFYGMFKGAFNYTIHKNRIILPNLPKSFNGLKIVQISDIHCGSFYSTEPLETAVKMINDLKADIVFFTGDMVNDYAKETDRFVNILKGIKAPMGVYSVLGNHDYADYVQWGSEEEKQENLNKMISRQRSDFGWNLLLNENKIIERNGERLAIVGVENIARSERNPRYGNLETALIGTEDISCKLLLSHDPYHWDAEVSEHFPEIDITFSGHTHGMQFGIEVPGIKWSPIQYIYEHWAGLYNKGKQFIYVNRGLGFVGYAGRAGIWPEITLHELKSGNES
jgi:uncharacterized protein